MPVPSTPSVSIRGSLRGRYYGNLGARYRPSSTPLKSTENEQENKDGSHSVTSPPPSPSPPVSPIYVPPQNVGLARSMHIPLWDDADSPILRWENAEQDRIPNKILGGQHHIFLKKADRTGVRVIMRKEGVIIDFLAPPFLNSPIPRLPYDDLRFLFPSVICVQFVLAGQFKDNGKMTAVHLDFNSASNFVSGEMLPAPRDAVYSKVDQQLLPLSFGQYSRVFVRSMVPLVLRGRDAKIVAFFPFDAYVISKRELSHFPYNRLILGRAFMERYLVSMIGDFDSGEVFFQDEMGQIYAQSYQRKRKDN